MIHLAIEEPRVEQFFHHSKDEIMKVLRFIVDNDIKDFSIDSKRVELSNEQKAELNSRIEAFHGNREMGRSWEEIKNELQR